MTSFASPAQDAEQRLQQQRLQALILCVFSVANYGLLYVTAIFLADLERARLRRLHRSLLGAGADRARDARTGEIRAPLLAGLAQSPGLGAVKRVPAVFPKPDPDHELTLRGKPYHVAIVIVAMFLPATAMFQFILEVAAAYGGQLKGVASYRLLFPALLFLLNAAVWTLLAASGGVSAAFCYGAAWVIAIAVLYVTTQSYVPAPVWQARPTSELVCGCGARSPWLPAAWCSPCSPRPA